MSVRHVSPSELLTTCCSFGASSLTGSGQLIYAHVCILFVSNLLVLAGRVKYDRKGNFQCTYVKLNENALQLSQLHSAKFLGA